MTSFEQGREYRVVLKSVPAGAIDQTVAELALLFPIEPAAARQIVEAAPIVLIDKLNAEQAANAESHLGVLRLLGADVEVTSEAPAPAKRMTLPVKPDIVRRPGNMLICPSCGERLVVTSWGGVRPAAAPPAHRPEPAVSSGKEAPPGPSVAEPLTVAPKEEGKSHRPVPSEGPWSAAAGEEAAPGAANNVEFPPIRPKTERVAQQPAEEPPPAPPKAAEAAPAAGRWSLAQEEEHPSQQQPPAAVEPDEPEIRILEEAPAPGRKAGRRAPGPGPSAETVRGEGRCRVSVAKRIKPKQKMPLAEVVARYQGISVEEAVKATSKSVITIMRNATREQAEECKAELKALGIPAEIRER
jgi:ribosomal protein L7/L12